MISTRQKTGQNRPLSSHFRIAGLAWENIPPFFFDGLQGRNTAFFNPYHDTVTPYLSAWRGSKDRELLSPESSVYSDGRSGGKAHGTYADHPHPERNSTRPSIAGFCSSVTLTVLFLLRRNLVLLRLSLCSLEPIHDRGLAALLR